jgi:hypothetical protein
MYINNFKPACILDADIIVKKGLKNKLYVDNK